MKLLRHSFNKKLMAAEAGDILLVYGGPGNWKEYTVTRVQAPYVFAPTAIHFSHIHKLAKLNGETWER